MNRAKICYWPDGDWCYSEEIHECTYKSDDYAEYVFISEVEITEEVIQKVVDCLNRG